MHDLVIRGGRVVDGTGAPPGDGDVAVDGQMISAVGAVSGPARREIEADGLVVTPGWVDVHTHYDGQATWDAELAPSSWHGVTTAVFGNCSVGFAPVRPGSEDYLINLMEGVEDIPGSVLAEGIDFTWESFGQYLDALEGPRSIDVGAQVPHAAVRFYVMGERGADHAERPTTDEIAEMGRIVAEGIAAGGLGFTTSRTKKHRAADGRLTPSLTADESELVGIARAVGELGVGQLQINSDFGTPDEWDLVHAMARVSGRPLAFSLIQVDHDPDGWRRLLDRVEEANGEGLEIRGQVAARPIGVLFGFDASLNPFLTHPTYQALADRPLADRVAELRRPEVRRALLAEQPDAGFGAWLGRTLERTFSLGDPPDYEPDPDRSLAATARREGRSVWELVLELLLEDDGRALLYHPFENYSAGDLGAVREMLLHPFTVSGLSDGGAHVATICDASFPTYLLTHWARDRTRGERIPLELLVHRQTQRTAQSIGLDDRGVVAPGYRADLNLIDLDGLRLHAPEIVHDLPRGGRRLLQRAEGYRHTFVAGTETFTDGEWTGATPGRLVRSSAAT